MSYNQASAPPPSYSQATGQPPPQGMPMPTPQMPGQPPPQAGGYPAAEPPPQAGGYPGAAPPQQQSVFRLSYVDFMPSQISGTGSSGFLSFSYPQFERFDVLVTRANQWLQQNPTMEVKTCESLEVKFEYHLGSSGGVVNPDRSLFYESGKVRSCYVRGLRLWFGQKMDPSVPPQQIRYINYVPGCIQAPSLFGYPQFESFGETVNKINLMMRQNPLPGKILTVETQDVKVRGAWSGTTIDPDKSFWYEDGNYRKLFLFIIRVFYVNGPPAYEEIGTGDFVPGCTHVPSGLFDWPQFEPYSQVAARACAWANGSLQGCRLANAQTLHIKISRKGWSGQMTIDSQRSSFVDAGNMATMYVRIMRLIFLKPLQGAVAPPRPVQLSIKTFVPAQISHGGMMSFPQFETVGQTMQRALAWLNAAGANVSFAETVPIKIMGAWSSRPPAAYAEESMAYDSANHGEIYLNILRIYLDGTYHEPPPHLLPPMPQVAPSKGSDCTIQ
ncbi:PREDICTED: uncharacterized protein LOC109475120 [Branchiostoma belcheri]|uniref:Uncharacterized protein LOC109475120 n=1 Tax=Branchiostoma belcheri TaxID=7741 RepID=A0A6P4ZNL0_BRABE|nr:PREDICTED: uncharacterized protein LOC109475120 [Branchiostoma belcheri]